MLLLLLLLLLLQERSASGSTSLRKAYAGNWIKGLKEVHLSSSNTQAKEGIPLILFTHVFIRVTYLIDISGVGRVFLSERRSLRGAVVQQRAARQGLSVFCKRRHLHWSMVRGSTMRLRYPHIRCVRCTLSTCCIPQLTHVDCGDDDQ